MFFEHLLFPPPFYPKGYSMTTIIPNSNKQKVIKQMIRQYEMEEKYIIKCLKKENKIWKCNDFLLEKLILLTNEEDSNITMETQIIQNIDEEVIKYVVVYKNFRETFRIRIPICKCEYYNVCKLCNVKKHIFPLVDTINKMSTICKYILDYIKDRINLT